MNNFSGVGNLASDVDTRTAPGRDGEQTVGNFLLALNRPGKDAGADFVRVTVWNKQAESCKQYLSKGKKVAVEGRVRTSRKENEDGSYTNYFEIAANRVEFLTPRPAEDGPQVEAEAKTAEATPAAAPQTDDIPF